jgi:hypothetical protein
LSFIKYTDHCKILMAFLEMHHQPSGKLKKRQ